MRRVHAGQSSAQGPVGATAVETTTAQARAAHLLADCWESDSPVMAAAAGAELAEKPGCSMVSAAVARQPKQVDAL